MDLLDFSQYPTPWTLENFSVYYGFFAYNALLVVTYLLTKTFNLSKTFESSLTFINRLHNCWMIFVSFALLALIIYNYFELSQTTGIPLTNFVEISLHPGRFKLQYFQEIVWVTQLTKFNEWIDTVLLILRNRNIKLLHWWHHATIAVAFYTGAYTGAYFFIGSLNSFIHVVMYTYYADFKWIKPIAIYLTQLQIIQLFGGAYMNYLSYHSPLNTTNSFEWSKLNCLICLSYGFLFIKFFVDKYILGKYDKKKRKTTKAE